MKHLNDYIKFNEELQEGDELGNQKYGPMCCKDCNYKADGFKFQKIFSKKMICPECNSNNIVWCKRPNVAPARQ